MENAYGIGVANRYALFLDEEDPLEVLKSHEQEREAKKKTKLSEKENKGKPGSKGKEIGKDGKAPQTSKKGIKETQNVKVQESGKAKDKNPTKATRPVIEKPEPTTKFAVESNVERNNRYNKDERPFLGAGEFNREARENTNYTEFRSYVRGGGGFRGRGRGGGVRGGFGRGGYDNRGKREFDRQSGSDKTGIKPVDKREGGGSHNWGTTWDDVEAQLDAPKPIEDNSEWVEKTEDVQVEPPQPIEDTPVPENDGAGDADENAQPAAEEEPRELTLDEYYAMRGSRQKPQYNIRKAGEGEDLSRWKKMYELKKKETPEGEEDDEEGEYDPAEYPQRVGRQKYLLDIDIHFTDSHRGSRGRGRGRGGFRGRGRGAFTPDGSRGGFRGAPRDGPRDDARDDGQRFPRGGRSPVGGGYRPYGDYGEREQREQREPRERPSAPAPRVDDEHDFPSLG